MDTMEISLIALAVSQSIEMFKTFVPDVQVLRNTEPSLQLNDTKNIRTAEFGAATMAIGIGALLTVLSKKPTPLIVATVLTVALVTLYEWSLTTTPFGGSNG